MTKFNIKFNVDFSHIHANDLKSFQHYPMFNTKPWSDLDLSILNGMDLNINLSDRVNNIFDELQAQPIEHINALDVLAITTINTSKWKQANAIQVAENWWLSLFKHHQNNLVFACVNACIYQHHQNLGHLGVKILNQTLLSKNFNYHDDMLLKLAKDILANNPSSLAKYLLHDKKTTPNRLLKTYPLTVNNDFKYKLNNDWINHYLRLSEKELTSYKGMIVSWLNEGNNIESSVTRAKIIFDNNYFDKNLQKLEMQTHKFTDIYTWLKAKSSDIAFKEKLGQDYLKILRVWIGAGNYYQLEKSVRYISHIHDEQQKEHGRNISLNRYFFWTNYQQYIVDYWLLLPKYHALDYDKITNTENIKWSVGLGNVPVIILRLDKYYVIQPLALKATKCDLVMTDDVVYMDKLLKKELIDIDELTSVLPCLIHDFYFGWQQEMYHILKAFDICSTNNRIKVAEKNYGDFCIDGLSELSISEKTKRQTALKDWYRSADSHQIRQSQQNLRQFARNLRIHGII